MHSFMNDSIIRQRPGQKVERGSTVPDWENTEDLLIRDCSVQSTAGSLDTAGRVMGITEGLTVYAPQADVQAGDRILWNGELYAIIGRPKIWNCLTGRVNNMQLNLKGWSG